MSNSKRKCKWCKDYGSDFVSFPAGTFCCLDHAIAFANDKKRKAAEKASKKKEKSERKVTKLKKKELMTRSQWFNKLQKVVNQWIKIRDKDLPCVTCGTTNPAIKYDAGHFIAVGRGGVDPRRFEPTNIHKQCSMQCNVHGSGMRAEYRDYITDRYGADHLEWLECVVNHKSLKETFPDWHSIEDEIIRYRAKVRELGYTPVI